MSTQHFKRNGRWVSRAQLLAMKEAEAAKEKVEEVTQEVTSAQHDAITTPQKLAKGAIKVLDGLDIEDLQEHYEALFEKPVPNAYKNKEDWIKNKIIEYVKE